MQVGDLSCTVDLGYIDFELDSNEMELWHFACTSSLPAWLVPKNQDRQCASCASSKVRGFRDPDGVDDLLLLFLHAQTFT
eukprot:6490109-Amphidinium_carterae.1